MSEGDVAVAVSSNPLLLDALVFVVAPAVADAVPVCWELDRLSMSHSLIPAESGKKMHQPRLFAEERVKAFSQDRDRATDLSPSHRDGRQQWPTMHHLRTSCEICMHMLLLYRDSIP